MLLLLPFFSVLLLLGELDDGDGEEGQRGGLSQSVTPLFLLSDL